MKHDNKSSGELYGGRVGAGKSAANKGSPKERVQRTEESQTSALRAKHDKHPMKSGSCFPA